ncbi:TPA: hypothetical protein HA244_04380 [Candidatus Micrarchaeota archaeon]|nr:hypothetical protein [Candidatus Micrarchaeota archaeon]
MAVKIGLEIHQRLDTHKLHCNCQANPSAGKAEFVVSDVVQRRLKAVGGELGLVDVAAAFEARQKRVFEYLIDGRHSCLVESDEQPPLPLNEDALAIVLGFAKALHSQVVDEAHVMRKTITDGSAVSGFQRTTLVAMGGFLETSKGKVGVQSIAVEEESAGIVEKTSDKFTYRLDRLGIPLVEIATAPDIKDGEHAKEVAEKLGGILRDSGRVQRGLGTIRQDLNISVDSGERVELKGVQDLRMMPKIIDVEIARQKKDGVKNGGETRRIEGTESEFMRPLAGAARIYPETDVPHVSITAELLARAVVGEPSGDKAAKLEKLGLNGQLAERLAKSGEYALFEKIHLNTRADATVIASSLLETLTSLKREGIAVEKITEGQLLELFSLLAEGKIVKAAVGEITRFLPSGKSPGAIVKEKHLERISGKELEALAVSGKGMGELMRDYRLRVDAGELGVKMRPAEKR